MRARTNSILPRFINPGGSGNGPSSSRRYSNANLSLWLEHFDESDPAQVKTRMSFLERFLSRGGPAKETAHVAQAATAGVDSINRSDQSAGGLSDSGSDADGADDEKCLEQMVDVVEELLMASQEPERTDFDRTGDSLNIHVASDFFTQSNGVACLAVVCALSQSSLTVTDGHTIIFASDSGATITITGDLRACPYGLFKLTSPVNITVGKKSTSAVATQGAVMPMVVAKNLEADEYYLIMEVGLFSPDFGTLTVCSETAINTVQGIGVNRGEAPGHLFPKAFYSSTPTHRKDIPRDMRHILLGNDKVGTP